MKKNLPLALLALFAFCISAVGQKKIVILGSSTAFGTGASTYDSSWAGRLQLFFRRNTSAGDPDTTIVNLALGGTTTYDAMPSPPEYTPPYGRPPYYPGRNVNAALAENPNIIIINYPSNDIANNFTKTEIMYNLRLLFNKITSAGVKCYITTTQPRNFLNTAQLDSQRTLFDSIKNTFGLYAIDFWTPIVNPDGSNTIRPDLNVDGIHVNNIGHNLLFQQVVARNIFAANSPLPLTLTRFTALMESGKAVLRWETQDEEDNTSFEVQRSANGRDFTSLQTVPGGGHLYSFADAQPLQGKGYYRLRIVESSRTSFSKTVPVGNTGRGVVIERVCATTATVSGALLSDRSTTVTLSIISSNGTVLYRQNRVAGQGVTEFTVPVSRFAAGAYILCIDGDYARDRRSFVK